MKVTNVKAHNFASYKELDIDMSGRGLTLVHGANGSGKSTLCDLIAWTLFGTTSKNGPVTDVVSWPGTAATEVTVQLVTENGNIAVTRKRGLTPKQGNDLFFTVDQGDLQRGKDLQDTQKRLSSLLAVTPDQYLLSAYMHEVSQTSAFFTTTAKNRRELCEQMIDLSLAKSLQEKTKTELKTLGKAQTKLAQDLQVKTEVLQTIQTNLKHANEYAKTWTDKQNKAIKDAEKSIEQFGIQRTNRLQTLQADIQRFDAYAFTNKIETLKQQIAQYVSVCSTCGAPLKSQELQALQKELAETTAELKYKQIERAQLEAQYDYALKNVNPYQAALERLREETNPHSTNTSELSAKAAELKERVQEWQANLEQVNKQMHLLEVLASVLEPFRSTLIDRTITEIQDGVNDLLTRFFDSEITVEFNVADADKVEVDITKNGNACSYGQLSKGQRQILKLCFGVSVMKTTSSRLGVHFDQLFFDEAFDGLDYEFKGRAFSLLTELAQQHDSVFVVDHSLELKSLFDNQIEVALVEGQSVLNEKAG
jgi:exonuclease SbcC